MKKTAFVFLSFLSVFLCANPGYSACDYQVALYDSYGDGWNGGYLTVYVEGVPVLSNISLGAGGGPVYHTFSVENGDVISTLFTPGSWPGECSYTILDSEGNSVATDVGESQPGGLSGVIAVCPHAENIPTLSEWGLMAMAMMLGAGAILALRRQKKSLI
jgi:hypothetical protein